MASNRSDSGWDLLNIFAISQFESIQFEDIDEHCVGDFVLIKPDIDLSEYDHIEEGFGGQIRWTGLVNGEQVLGIELAESISSGTNGKFHYQLFECDKGRGILIPINLAEVISPEEYFRKFDSSIPTDSSSDFNSNDDYYSEIESLDEYMDPQSTYNGIYEFDEIYSFDIGQVNERVLKVNQRMSLNLFNRRLTGILRWTGLADDVICGGFEMDADVENGTDGDFSGYRLFVCRPRRGILIPLSSSLFEDNEESLVENVKAAVKKQPFRKLFIQKNQIEFICKLGRGGFGEVYHAKWHRGEISINVAVKRISQQDTVSQSDFTREAEIMHRLNHPNLVSFLGCFKTRNNFSLVIEYMANKSLKSFLRIGGGAKYRLKPDLLNIFQQVTDGMTFLHSKDFIHRDLRADNVLVDYLGNCKVADFGLARLLSEEGVYESKSRVFPVSWTPPEAFDPVTKFVFTKESDVWSFGVLMYEVVTFGATPYKELKSHGEIKKFVKKGNRLSNPHGTNGGKVVCPNFLYDIMSHCWRQNSGDRPSFAMLSDKFKDMSLISE